MSQDSPDSSGLPPEYDEHGVLLLPEKREGYWRKFGGGSLTISIIVHAVLILIAVLWIRESMMPVKEEERRQAPHQREHTQPAHHQNNFHLY